MAVWTNDNVMDAALDYIAGADEECVCSAQPTTYYEAKDPATWVAGTAYALGDAVRPTTRNGYAYECTVAGTSDAATEPTWPTVPGTTVVDGTVTWTCRANYALANVAVTAADFTKADGDTSGRKVTVAEKTGITVHTSGDATHVALVDDAAKELLDVTTCTLQTLTAGNTVTVPAWDHEIQDPA